MTRPYAYCPRELLPASWPRAIASIAGSRCPGMWARVAGDGSAGAERPSEAATGRPSADKCAPRLRPVPGDRGRGERTAAGVAAAGPKRRRARARFIVMRCRLPTTDASPSTSSAVSPVRSGRVRVCSSPPAAVSLGSSTNDEGARRRAPAVRSVVPAVDARRDSDLAARPSSAHPQPFGARRRSVGVPPDDAPCSNWPRP